MAYKKRDDEHLKMLKLPRQLHSKLKLIIALEEIKQNKKIYMSALMIEVLQGYAEEALNKHSITFEIATTAE
jgi:hypothetical protein